MAHKRISSGSKFEELYGHSRAVRAGNTVYVAGTVGYDYANHTVSEDPAEQTRETFRNIEIALKEAGASLSDLVQIVTYYKDQNDWDAIGGVLRETLQDIRPVNAGVCTGFVVPEIKVEISAIAVRET